MITGFKKVIDKLVELSKNGYLAVSYQNDLISVDFKLTEELTLENFDDGSYRLYYLDELHACPSELRVKESDVLKATYYAEGEFEKLPFEPVIVIMFKDKSELHLFEDVK